MSGYISIKILSGFRFPLLLRLLFNLFVKGCDFFFRFMRLSFTTSAFVRQFKVHYYSVRRSEYFDYVTVPVESRPRPLSLPSSEKIGSSALSDIHKLSSYVWPMVSFSAGLGTRQCTKSDLPCSLAFSIGIPDGHLTK